MTVKNKLQQKFNTLTPPYRKICKYLLDNYDCLDKLSIQQISTNCGSGLSTIFRLCQKMGYKGFKEMRDDILKEIYLKDIKKSENLEDAILQFEIHMVEELRNILSSDYFKEAVTKCASAKKLLWIGIGDSANMLSFMDFRCHVLEIDSNIIADPVRYIMGINDLKKSSVILMISQSGNTTLLKEAIEAASASPATFIGITGNRESILAKASDISLVIPSWDVNTTKHYFTLRGPEIVFFDLFLLSIGVEKGTINKKELNNIFYNSKNGQ
jgi:RpiR family transcriptional regulator, carbohydrate utilization regulator